MNHVSNTTEKDSQYKICVHGICFDHNPDWEVMEKLREPNPTFFGLVKTYWSMRHCGEAMSRYKDIIIRRCRNCHRTERELVVYTAVCLCRAHHYRAYHAGDD